MNTSIGIIETGIQRGETFIETLNTNKYFISLAAVFVFLGSRELALQMGNTCNHIFKSHIVKKLTLFSIMFLYTRDIPKSLVVTIILIFIFSDIFFKDSDHQQIKCNVI